jgi:hypothetical protein
MLVFLLDVFELSKYSSIFKKLGILVKKISCIPKYTKIKAINVKVDNTKQTYKLSINKSKSLFLYSKKLSIYILCKYAIKKQLKVEILASKVNL